ALCFLVGALVPLLTIALAPKGFITQVVTCTALGALVLLGGLSAYAGGAPIKRGALRMLFWGSLAMGLTAVVGRSFGAMP
ncbi:MAG: VIT family protein, partial [Synechococcaceae bacterium WB6_3B_236]|nr:VIT family protein [Synechococcaceae bacterium WB6_3B_236]